MIRELRFTQLHFVLIIDDVIVVYNVVDVIVVCDYRVIVGDNVVQDNGRAGCYNSVCTGV